MKEILSWSAVETAKHLQNRDVSVVEVTSAHLEQAHAVNPSINAMPEIDDTALDRAAQMDAAGPNPDQSLWGVPVTTKINADQKGFVNSNGVPALKDNLCAEDSAVAANFKAAGAVIIARTNTPEFSMRWFTSNPLHGVTLNPVNKALTPGGSSGGASAAIAANVGCIAHGNDLGGSLRYPAFCCGVATIRPSMGRVPTVNPSAQAERPPMTAMMSVQGPIARSVGDVELGLRALSRRSSQDPLWTNAPDSGRDRSTPLRIGYCRNPFSVEIEDDTITHAMTRAVEAAKAAGATLIEMPFPDADRAAELWGDLLFAETQFALGDMVREHGSEEFNRLCDQYLSTYSPLDLHGYFASLADRTRIQKRVNAMFDDVDVFIMPTSLTRPFENDLDFKDPGKVPFIIDAQRPLHAINLLGLPSAAIPTGIAGDIPTGVQIIGPMHDDWFVLSVAEKLERQLMA